MNEGENPFLLRRKLSGERWGGVVCALESIFAELLHLVLRQTISVSRTVSPESHTKKIILKQILAEIVKLFLFYS